MINENQKQILLKSLAVIEPKKVGVFGSFSRGENGVDSDLDVLIYLSENQKVSLLQLIGLEQELSELLGIKVDLVTSRSLKPEISSYVEKDLIIIS